MIVWLYILEIRMGRRVYDDIEDDNAVGAMPTKWLIPVIAIYFWLRDLYEIMREKENEE